MQHRKSFLAFSVDNFGLRACGNCVLISYDVNTEFDIVKRKVFSHLPLFHLNQFCGSSYGANSLYALITG